MMANVYSRKSGWHPITGHAATIETWMAYRNERRLFLASYRDASELYRGGDHEVEFPKGSFPPWIRKVA
jgi:hypothetical protein